MTPAATPSLAQASAAIQTDTRSRKLHRCGCMYGDVSMYVRVGVVYIVMAKLHCSAAVPTSCV